VFTDINADHGNCAVEVLGHGVLLCLCSPLPDSSLAGQEHGRTIPLAAIQFGFGCHTHNFSLIPGLRVTSFSFCTKHSSPAGR
ncbi:MAG TPA: hypothetical protein VGU90_01180, partial [Terriglobales bacterium]|nr:hypothetical protein [Terriglobales bacterium]